MPRSRRSKLLLTVATLALPVALGACSTLETSPLEPGMRSPSGGTMEPVGDAAKIDAGRLTRIAKATEAAGDLSNAAAMYQRAVVLDPESVEALLALAQIYGRLGAPENAAHAYRAVISRKPDNREARRGLGNALIALERPDEALVEFERLIAADPLDPRGYNGRGVALSMAGRYEEARESFETGLRLAPDDVQLNNNLALSLAMSGRAAEAIPILKRLSSRADAPERVRENLARAERSAADSVRVSDLAPPESDRAEPSDVLYQGPPATLPPVSEHAPSNPIAPEEPEKPAALGPRAAVEIDSRQASGLIEADDQAMPAERADPNDIPTNAAEPAAGGIEPDAQSGLVVIGIPATATQDATPLPHPSANAPAAADVASGAAEQPRSTLADPPAEAARAASAPLSSAAAAALAEAAQVRAAVASAARADPTAESRRDVEAAAPLPCIAPSGGGDTAPDRVATAERDRPIDAGAPSGGDVYRVQLSAERSSDMALARWRHLSEAAPDLLGGLTPFVSTTTRPDGVLYRLRTSLMSRAAALTLCTALTARDIPCYLAAVRSTAPADAPDPGRIAPAAGDASVSAPPAAPPAELAGRPWHAL